MVSIAKMFVAFSLFVTTCCATPLVAKKPVDPLSDLSSASDPTPSDPVDASEGNTKRTIIYLDFELDDTSVDPIITALRQATASDEIIIIFNTPGGEMNAGTKLATAIRFSSAKIICDVDGQASSMGGVVLQSCPVRAMEKWSLIMIHLPRSIAAGNSSDMRTGADELDIYGQQMFAMLMSHSKLTLEQLKKKTRDGKRWWLRPDEALKLGLIDQIL